MPNRLSKLFSSSDREKEALAEAERNASRNDLSDSSSQRPPSYQQEPTEWDRENFLQPPDITAGFSNLSISKTNDDFPTKEECIAHLKVLECFYKLKQAVGSHDGLFGIYDKLVTGQNIAQNDKTGELLAKLAEKRWAVYLQRAVDRFETWWSSVTPQARMADRTRLESQGRQGWLCKIENIGGSPLRVDKNNMPPADVLMVWHAFMLNPRAYLEDCLRNGRMELWHCQMPWQAAAECITSETFAFDADAATKNSFSSITGLAWDNLADANSRILYCPRCRHQNRVPWTTCSDRAVYSGISDQTVLEYRVDEVLSSGRGFCDKDFKVQCGSCLQDITHERLQGSKFTYDIERLLKYDVPMGGTVLGLEGIPWKVHGSKDTTTETIMKFPNELLKQGLGAKIVEQGANNYYVDGVDVRTVTGIRDLIETTMKNKKYMRKTRVSASAIPQRVERIAIRKMMSRYWDNSSPFALDLIGAVIRQGSFIEKMHNIDWLHSPALPNTMQRLIQKYAVFMQIMASNHQRMAVPTLDVDLAWHTHQLNPPKYMEYTVKRTSQFIDHDDKIAETKLNDAFAWTSKTYQKLTGEPYSECTCWYCEAIRESHTSSASRLFNTSSARVADMVHGAEQDPRKSVHISAHNAVRPADDSKYTKESDAHARALEEQYQKACERAKKKGKPVPKRDDYYYSDAYGYPVYIPAYAPYYYMPYAPMYYPVTPGCMAVSAGAAGNCCAGTCGGSVAAGGCGGSGGVGCAGGASGGCGGGGGGGGGGCGGGGGGG